MKLYKIPLLASLLLISIQLFADTCTDIYDMKIYAYMPRVYDNMQSLGYRKYQRQIIIGQMSITYGEDDTIELVTFSKFTNKTYSVSGKPVTYDVTMNEDSLYNFSWCGSNRSEKYTKPNCNFSIEMIPSYKIGEEILDDVHLSIACVSGNYKKIKNHNQYAIVVACMKGYCVGQIGCNCTAWGHISPTRQWGFFGPSDIVTDIASINGQVIFKWNKILSRK